MIRRSVLILKHIPYDTGGHAVRLLEQLPTSEALFPQRVPPVDELAGLVLLGGDMSAADTARHPSLELAARLALDAIEAEVPVLGLCLGHQIIARALGARHREGGAEEIGLVEVEVVAEDSWLGAPLGTLPVVQWHGDEVGLPAGATLVARNAAVANQGFRYGSALGLQFHLEVDGEMLRRWNTVSEPAMHELLPDGDWEGLEERYLAATALHEAAERGFAAFAEACRARL